jgi:hypothetical protein
MFTLFESFWKNNSPFKEVCEQAFGCKGYNEDGTSNSCYQKIYNFQQNQRYSISVAFFVLSIFLVYVSVSGLIFLLKSGSILVENIVNSEQEAL